MTFTTHKTLRGPRGGAILCGADLAKAIDSAVFPGLQGGPLEHVIAAKAVAFGEALKPAFREYAARVVRNAAALAEALTAKGFRLVAGGTDNHLVLVDLRTFEEDLTGKVAQEVLDRTGITCNRNAIPERPEAAVRGERAAGSARPPRRPPGSARPRWPRSPRSSPGRFAGREDEEELASVRGAVRELCGRFDPYPGGVASAG